jgi:hypothetical protein
MKRAANNSAGTKSSASPSKKLRSISVGSTLTGKVSVDDIDDADSARGKNLWPACNSPVGDSAHLDLDAEDLSPKPSANILASPSCPVHTNSPPNSLPDVNLGKDRFADPKKCYFASNDEVKECNSRLVVTINSMEHHISHGTSTGLNSCIYAAAIIRCFHWRCE